MSEARPVRGTHDIMGAEMRRQRKVAETARAVADLYGYGEIETPVFEFTEVFARSLGDASDVVTKEMYTFEDRGGDSLTLRPENTASIVRAVITGGLTQQLPLKFFYFGPMFRYERPQKGRLREFHQIGVELIGAPEPMGDVEVIALGAHILEALGLGPDRVTLELNTLGDLASRHAYREILVGYLSGHKDRLSEDSLARLERNPLAHPGQQGRGRPRRPGRGAPSRGPSQRGEPRLLRPGARGAGPARHRVSGKPAAGPRPRLLHPHGVRVHDDDAGRPGHGDGGRPL